MTRTWWHSRRALKAYDESADSRDQLWHNAQTAADVDAAEAADREAAALVQLAFYKDTKDVNRLEDMVHVHVLDIRRMVYGEESKCVAQRSKRRITFD